MAASMDEHTSSYCPGVSKVHPEYTSSKSSKKERKTRKKVLRSQHTVLKHDGIEVSEHCTKILCVNNAGLDVGVSYDEVHTCFCCHGDIDDIIMLPKKPYSFVCFKQESDATNALENLNGTELPKLSKESKCLTMYIFYVSKVPSELTPSTDIPPGLILLKDFVTVDYSEQLLQAINWIESSNPEQQRELKHRQVKHYGYEFKYGINDVDVNDPLPEGIPTICTELLQKALDTGHVHHWPDQLTINRYQPSQGIPPHVDTPCAFEDGIMSLSLGSQVLMDFRHPDGRHLTVVLPPNSLLIMTGESRYVWSHGITPRKSDIIPASDGKLNVIQRGTRTSFTFRKIVHPDERKRRKLLQEKEKSDDKPAIPQSSSEAASLENQHVHQVYEKIADHFSGTRHTPWPRIVDFLNEQAPGSLLADIGCGNGKYLGLNKSLYEIGSDRSKNLVDICREKQCQVFVGDILSVPIRSGCVDVCICIAVIHHLSTEERRLQAIAELLRILRIGGTALIYVWAMEQEMNKVKSKYLKEKTFEKDKNHVENESTNDCRNRVQLPSDCPPQGGNENQRQDRSLSDENSVSVAESQDGSDKSSDFVAESHDKICDSNIPSIGLKSEENKRCRESCTSNADSRSDKCCQENVPSLAVHKNRTQFQQQDLLVPWQLKQKKTESDKNKLDSVFHRYYHVFQKGELETLCGKVPDCKVIGGYYDQGNWAVILEKI